LFSFFPCISKDEFQYFVFDYLNDYKNLDVINDENLPKNIEDFIKNNFLSIGTIVLSDRKILGSEKYNRAELISVEVQLSTITPVDSFTRKICVDYQQAIDLNEYFKSIQNFCPNCSFIDAADKYYWFETIIPFLPLWITLIGKKKLKIFIFVFKFVFSWICSNGGNFINTLHFKCTKNSGIIINESKNTC
jgi:hypothetical protein